jgi:hypothetical protein
VSHGLVKMHSFQLFALRISLKNLVFGKENVIKSNVHWLHLQLLLIMIVMPILILVH